MSQKRFAQPFAFNLLGDAIGSAHNPRTETGPAAGVLTSPSHPYTKQLVAAVPVLEGPPVTA